MLQLSVLLLSFILSCTKGSNYFTNFSEECDLWADRDGECINNHSFMWSKCTQSCLNLSNDDDSRCEAWASEGECTNNPRYIQVHCPRSCQLAIAWSPWVRSTLGLDVPSFSSEDALTLRREPCDGNPIDVYSAAKIVHQRLKHFLWGHHMAVVGLTSSAPTEYLGMLGLSEAVLYCLRLYEVALHAGLAGANADDETDLGQQATLNKERIQRVLSTLSEGYSSDLIMRALPGWLRLVDDSEQAARRAVARLRRSSPDDLPFCEPSDSTPQLAALVSYFGTTPDSMVDAQAAPSYALLNGVEMPSLGLGTWQLTGRDCYEAVKNAIRLGYRLIDTAQAYQNEHNVGDAIQSSVDEGVVAREDLFLATKLSDPGDAGYANVRALVERQLADLKTSYIDLYMLHSPLPNQQLQQETWRALEDLVSEGKLRAIGVSNFQAAELQALIAHSRVPPMVVQNKADPYHVGKQLDNAGDPIVKVCKENGIVLMAYSTLSAYPFVMQPMDDPIVRAIARQHALSPSQVLLKWALQKGFAVIPRSTSSTRLAENLAVFSEPNLPREDMQLLDTLQLLVSSPVCKPVPA